MTTETTKKIRRLKNVPEPSVPPKPFDIEDLAKELRNESKKRDEQFRNQSFLMTTIALFVGFTNVCIGWTCLTMMDPEIQGGIYPAGMMGMCFVVALFIGLLLRRGGMR